MIALLQRVSRASVSVDGIARGTIGTGILVLLGVAKGDGPDDLSRLVEKVRYLRIFPDDRGIPNLDIAQAGGSVLCVSQFTLLADCRKGRRPGYSPAEEPGRARVLWEDFCTALEAAGIPVERGVFGADMRVELVNEGPFTLHLDSRT